jgi:hypothetical protein
MDTNFWDDFFIIHILPLNNNFHLKIDFQFFFVNNIFFFLITILYSLSPSMSGEDDIHSCTKTWWKYKIKAILFFNSYDNITT